MFFSLLVGSFIDFCKVLGLMESDFDTVVNVCELLYLHIVTLIVINDNNLYLIMFCQKINWL